MLKVQGLKHSPVHNSINMHRFKWKWLKIHANFEFFEWKIHKHLKNTLIYKAKQFMFTKKEIKKSPHILEDGASSLQVDILDT